jgi:hypothetical protein
MRIIKHGKIVADNLNPNLAKFWFEKAGDEGRGAYVEHLDHISKKWIVSPFYWGIDGFTWGTYGA